MANQRKLKTPFRDLLPPHTSAELAALHASFELNGPIDPVEVDSTGNVLDHHIGYDWCIVHKRTPQIKIVAGLATDAEKKAYILARHLGHRATPPSAKQRGEYVDILLTANSNWSDGKIAAMVGVSAAKVLRQRNALVHLKQIPKVMDVLGKDGVVRKIGARQKKVFADNPFHLAAKWDEPAEYLGRHLESISHLPHITGLQQSLSNIRRTADREAKREGVFASPEALLPSDFEVRRSDFRNLDIADESIDLVCTDVLWAVAHQKDWVDLAAWSRQKLKPLGLFVTLHGVLYIPQTVEAFGKHLRYQCQIVVKYRTAIPIIAKSLNSCWRPAWVYSRQEGIKRKFGNMWNFIEVKEEGGMAAKEFHKFQQSTEVFRELLRRLSKPGDLVCDPQCGTGTTGVACRQTGRRFIGGDLDPKMVKIAKHRIATEGLNDNGRDDDGLAPVARLSPLPTGGDGSAAMSSEPSEEV